MSAKSLLIETHPDIAAEWHPTRNGDLDLSTVATFSNKKIWWAHRLPDGGWHEWQQITRNRTWAGSGCTKCVDEPGAPRALDKQALRISTIQELVAVFDHAMNAPWTPEDFHLTDRRRIWWTWECGHAILRAVRAQRRIQTRINETPRCPVCTSTSHDRKGLRQAIAHQWHPDRNPGIDLYTAPLKSKAWWIDTCGHSWKATINARIYDATGCPRCARSDAGARIKNRYRLDTLNTLAEHMPAIAAQWHPARNGDLTPADVSYGSAKKAWWLCASGHEWEASVNSRTMRGGRGCWCCANPSSVPSPEPIDQAFSVSSLAPELAGQWHPSRNGLTGPDMVALRSAQQVWWRCAEGHTWRSRPSSRAGSDSGCRACANKAERARRAA